MLHAYVRMYSEKVIIRESGDREAYITKGNDGKKNISKFKKNEKVLHYHLSLTNTLGTITIFLYPDYRCHNVQKHLNITQASKMGNSKKLFSYNEIKLN